MTCAWFPTGKEVGMFRPLTIKEVKEFEEAARNSPPNKMEHWEIYHPVCRRVWSARGIKPPEKKEPEVDPTANLKEQLELARKLTPVGEGLDSEDLATKAFRLASLVEALHDWISHGGFLPDQWAGR